MRSLSTGCTFALCAALCVAGCSEKKKPDEAPPVPQPDKHYGDGAPGLRELWMDLVTAARRDDRDKVHDLMSSMIMTDDDLVALFGKELAAYFKPRYGPMIQRMVNAGALELVGQIAERKYDDVDIITMSPTSPDIEQRAILAALKTPATVFAVRVKKTGEFQGLRYDFFVYRRGRWVTGNQLGKFIAPPNDTSNTPTGFSMPSPSAPAAAKPSATPAAAAGDRSASPTSRTHPSATPRETTPSTGH